MDELAEIFADLGFAVATGPEIEDDWHNFTALNIPESHPARAMHDTFYFPDQADGEQKLLLRTHTSPVQIRTLLAQKPPVRIIAPDASTLRLGCDAHADVPPDRGAGDRQGDHARASEMDAGDDVEGVLRARRHRPAPAAELFPFTEPSAEIDVGFTLRDGKRVLGGDEGWMELLGSGMVHPKVIAACDLDPTEWQGFAFGVGVDRLAMLKYGMDDLRPFFEADIRWLKHYGFSALDVPTLSGGVGA